MQATKDNKDQKNKLEQVFRSYSQQGSLTRNQLKDAFEHLGAVTPNKQVEEAMDVADKNKDNLIDCTNDELDSLVDYAYNKGFSGSI